MISRLASGLAAALITGGGLAGMQGPEQLASTQAFLAELDSGQRQQVMFPFDHPEKAVWRRTPGERTGLGLFALTEEQRALAHAMLRSVLSTQGYLKAVNVMLNEDIQARVEPSLGRDRYWLAIYGTPNAFEHWAWRLEGHHLSVRFEFNGTEFLGASPATYGMHPAIIRNEGSRSGLAVLSGEEEIARRLARRMRARGVREAFSAEPPPARLHTEQATFAVLPEGAVVGRMDDQSRELVQQLIDEYLGNYQAEFATQLLDGIDVDDLRFVWHGGLGVGQSHYYRLHGPDLVIEYEHYGTERGTGNHIHAIWRDPRVSGGLLVPPGPV